ncbi:MAG: hypothetical protein QOE54_6925 [Streptosporangiaceae bacterium]|jgi:hypothetical protein|nr:hypothetical protein [Streptosporangiaceae bacterium]MDX6434559.1 hypothetical protein [Streptosporangiaceae bacterium]
MVDWVQVTGTKRRLISADSHVLVRPDDVRARLPRRLIPAYDDALATQAAANEKLRGGQVLIKRPGQPAGSVGGARWCSRAARSVR